MAGPLAIGFSALSFFFSFANKLFESESQNKKKGVPKATILSVSKVEQNLVLVNVLLDSAAGHFEFGVEAEIGRDGPRVDEEPEEGGDHEGDKDDLAVLVHFGSVARHGDVTQVDSTYVCIQWP